MTLSVRVDPASNSALYVLGDEFVLDVRWLDKDGTILPIAAEAEYTATITRSGHDDSIASVSHELVGGSLEPTARFSFPLAIAADLAAARGVYVTIQQILSAGPPARAVSLFTFNLPVRQLAGALAPIGGLTPDLTAPTLVEVGPHGVFISPRGPSGATAAQQLASAIDPATGDPYISGPTAGAMAGWLLDRANLAVAPSITDAQAAATYAHAQGDYALEAAEVIADMIPAGNANRAPEFNTLFAGTRRNITLAPGKYLLSKGAQPQCVTIADRQGLIFDGRGSRLVSDYSIGNAENTLGVALQLAGCTDTVIKGLRLDYTVSPSASGQITAIAVDRSGFDFLAVSEPPHFTDFDRYITQSERLEVTEVTEYAARDVDYDPTVNYSVQPLDGQAVGQPGRYRVAIPLIAAALATVVAGTSDLTFRTSAPHGLPNGCSVVLTGVQGLQRNGASIVNELVLSAAVISPTDFRVQYSEDDPVSTVGATPYVPGTGTVTMQRVPADVEVGDRAILWHRKHLNSPILAYGCANLTLGVPGVPLVFTEAAAVAVKGRDIDGLNLEIHSKRGAAGCVVMRDVRGIVSGRIVCDFSGDDVLQLSTSLWGRRILGPFVSGSTTAIAPGAYLDVQFATSRTQQVGVTPPRLRDLVAFAEPTYNTPAATLMVVDIQPLGPPGQYRVFFSDNKPASLTIDWFVLNASCRPKYRELTLVCRGGGRLFLPSTDDAEIDLIAGYGMNNSIVLARDPLSPTNPILAGAAGGFRCRKLIARNSQWSYGHRNSAVLSMRRNGLSNQTTNAASDAWYHFDDADIDGSGYGGVAVSGFNARFGKLSTDRTGQKRGAIPVGDLNPQARNDLFAEQGIIQVDDYGANATFSFYEAAGGFVFFPNGSLLVREATIVGGALTTAAAKKVQVGHERRVRVWIDGHEQDPASYTANDTATLTFDAAPFATGTATCVVEHVRC